MPVKLAFRPSRTDTIKSPTWVVVTAAPGVLLRVTVPEAVLSASGAKAKTPDTSQDVISTLVGEPTNVGVITVAPELEFIAYQISDVLLPLTHIAPAET